MDSLNYQSLLDNSILPQPVAKLPFGHNIYLVEEVKDKEPAFLQQAVAKLPCSHITIKAEINLPDRSRPTAPFLRWNQQMGNCN